MAILTGEVLPLNSLEAMMHPVGASIVVKLGSKTIASGKVQESNEFEIELPDDAHGEIEVELGLQNAAPALADYHGQDLHITLLYSNVNNFIA